MLMLKLQVIPLVSTSIFKPITNVLKFCFQISCHGIVWLASWLSFIWLFNVKDLYQIQVNMLIGMYRFDGLI